MMNEGHCWFEIKNIMKHAQCSKMEVTGELNPARIERTTLRISQLESHALPLCQGFIDERKAAVIPNWHGKCVGCCQPVGSLASLSGT